MVSIRMPCSLAISAARAVAEQDHQLVRSLTGFEQLDSETDAIAERRARSGHPRQSLAEHGADRGMIEGERHQRIRGIPKHHQPDAIACSALDEALDDLAHPRHAGFQLALRIAEVAGIHRLRQIQR